MAAMRRDADTLDLFAAALDPEPAATAVVDPPPAVERLPAALRNTRTMPPPPTLAIAPARGETEAWAAFAEDFDTHARYDSPDDYAAHRYQLAYLSGLYEPYLDFTPDDWAREMKHEARLRDMSEKKKSEYLKKHPNFSPLDAALARCAPAWFYHGRYHGRDTNVARWRELLKLPDEDRVWTNTTRAQIEAQIERYLAIEDEQREESRLAKLTHRAFLAGTLDTTPCLRCGATDGRHVERPWCLRCHFIVADVERAPVAPKGYEHPSVAPRWSGWDEYQGPAWTEYRVDLHFTCLSCGDRCNMHGVCLRCLDASRAGSPHITLAKDRKKKKPKATAPTPIATEQPSL